MEEQQSTSKLRGTGKEEQLSKIAAAVNTGSAAEANPTATKGLITTFINNFNDSALEIVNEINDNEKDLIKNMVDEITKLQTKNMQEFEKAIGRIVGISEKLIESNNPKIQALGQGLKDQAKEEAIKSSGFNLTGDKDTFGNRLRREISGSSFDPNKEKVTGIGKRVKGFFANTKNEIKKGFSAAVEEGSVADKVLRSDEEKRQRTLSRIEESSQENNSTSATEEFKKVIEQILKDPASIKEPKSAVETASDAAEDAAGISKDAGIEAITAIGASVAILENNSNESLDIFKDMLERLVKLSDWFDTNGQELLAAGGGGGGGGLLDTAGDLLGGGFKKGRGILSKVGGGISKAGGFLAKNSKILGSAAAVGYGAYQGVTGYMDASENQAAREEDIQKKVASREITKQEAEKLKKQSKKTGTVEKSSAAGKGTGAAIGGVAGSVLGSALGPVGTVVGGAAGAWLGEKAGGWLGSKAGEAINWWNEDDEKPKPAAKPKPAVVGKPKSNPAATPAPKAPVAPTPFEAEEIVVTAPRKPKATVEKPKQENKPNAVASVKEATKPKEKTPDLNAVDKSIKGKVAEIDPDGRWAKLKDGKIVDPDFPNDADANYTAQRAYKLTAGKSGNREIGKVDANQNNSGETLKETSKKANAKTETGRNFDGNIVEAGTAATKEKMQVNVPPPTVIQQNSGGGNSAPTITAPGGVRNVRADDPTWLRFQQKRAVA